MLFRGKLEFPGLRIGWVLVSDGLAGNIVDNILNE